MLNELINELFRPRPLIAIAIGLWVLVVPLYFVLKKQSKCTATVFYEDRDHATDALAASPQELRKQSVTARNAHLLAYGKCGRQLELNLHVHLLLIILSIVTVMSGSGTAAESKPGDSPDVSILDLVKVPAKAMYGLLPFAFTYVWSQFGYYLHAMIHHRFLAWNMMSFLEQFKGTPWKPNSVFSHKHAFFQSPFVASWFNAFSKDALEFNKKEFRAYTWAIVFLHGLLYGIAHAACLTMACLGIGRWNGYPWIQFGFFMVGVVGTTLYFAMTHYMFQVKGRNENWMQWITLCTTPLALACFYGAV